MKREKLPTVEDLSAEFSHIQLAPLAKRGAGIKPVEVEHCLIEVLDELSSREHQRHHYVGEYITECIEARDWSSFMLAYSSYTKERGDWGRRHANFSIDGRFFYALRQRLSDRAEQLEAEQSASVGQLDHACALANIVVRQLDRMAASSGNTSVRVEQCFFKWMASQDEKLSRRLQSEIQN